MGRYVVLLLEGSSSLLCKFLDQFEPNRGQLLKWLKGNLTIKIFLLMDCMFRESKELGMNFLMGNSSLQGKWCNLFDQ